MTDHRKNLIKLIEQCRYRHDLWRVWSDFCELTALSISNSVDLRQYEKREARYMEIIGMYKSEEQKLFPQMYGELVLAMEDGFDDILGKTFMGLELGNKWQGQFFTPYEIAHMMGMLNVGDGTEIREKIVRQGHISVCDPCIGGGAMILGFAHAMRDAGLDYQRHMHVTATDIDATCVHMAYIQFSLHYIPAVVIHGDSLKLEEYGHWFTPAHILDGWDRKLSGRMNIIDALQALADGTLPEPDMVLPEELPALPAPDLNTEKRQLALF